MENRKDYECTAWKISSLTKPEEENENPVCINWDHVDQWRELPQVTEEVSDQEHVVLLTSKQEQVKKGIDVKKRQIENMENQGRCECMPDIGQKWISTRWFIMEKFKDKKKIIMKAHLVARSYGEDSHNLKTDCLSCSCEAMHIVMLTVLVMKRQVESLNFTSMFLLGDKLEREKFLKPPPDICSESQLWKLKRCMD